MRHWNIVSKIWNSGKTHKSSILMFVTCCLCGNCEEFHLQIGKSLNEANLLSIGGKSEFSTG